MKDKGSKLMRNDRKRPISEAKKREIIEHIASCGYDIFISVNLPINIRTNNLDRARFQLYYLMKGFFKVCCGASWYKHVLPFHAFIELGEDLNYHFHIAMKTNEHNDFKKIKDCFNIIAKNRNFHTYVIDVTKIEEGTENKVISYINKLYNDENDSKKLVAYTHFFPTKSKINEKLFCRSY